jgi:hypothetical protein
MNCVRSLMILMVFLVIGLLFLLPGVFGSDSTGVIRGHVVVPKTLDTEKSPKEAKIFVYILDLAIWKRTKQPRPPIDLVQEFPIRDIKEKKVSFEFTNVKPGKYQVSAFIDNGRPHIRPGSKAFVAYPGDYTSLKDPEVTLKAGEVKEVAILYGAYIKIPDGYTSPIYLPK